MDINIIPEVKNIKINEGFIRIEDFYLESLAKEKVPKADEILAEAGGGQGEKPIVFIENTDLNKEAYSVIVGIDKISISASNPKGLFYGIITISELSKLNNGKIDCCTIFDEPDMEFRAISDDISRGQVPTIESLKYMVKNMAKYKLNIYMPYIEDVFAFASLPEFGKYSDPISPKEWKELCSYAKEYYVSVRPIINMLGHWDKNGCLEEFQDVMLKIPDKSGLTKVLDPENKKTRKMLLKMLDEIVDTFGPGPIHAGGDEPCELTEAYGKEKAGKLYVEHYRFLSEELKKRGCSMIMYADVFAPPWGDYSVGLEKALELPLGTTFVFWDYAVRDNYHYVEKLNDMGLDILLSPGCWNWNRLAPQLKLCWDNTKGLIKAANRKNRGIIMSIWDDGGDSLRQLNWAGIAIGGLFAWNNDSIINFELFLDSFHKLFYGFNEFDQSKIYYFYNYDECIGTDDYSELRCEFWKDARKPVCEKLKETAIVFLEKLEQIEEYLLSLEPKRNIDAFEELLFSLKREIFAARKLCILKAYPYKNREEAIYSVEAIEELAMEIKNLHEIHKKLWFKTNRYSEWGLLDAMYIDLEESLKSLARYCRYSKKMDQEKFLI